MCATLGGPDHQLGPVGEEQRADAIVVARGGQGQHRGNFDREPGLGVGPAEIERPRLVDDQQEGELPLFHECLDEGMAHAGRDIPVDRAEIVALLVGAHFRELDPLPAKDGAVFAREQRVDEAASPELDPLDLLEDVPGDHGTPTASRMRPIT